MTAKLRFYTSKFIGIAPLIVLLSSCASVKPGMLHSTTSEPKSIDAQVDNASVLTQLSPSLLIVLEVNGTSSAVIATQVARAPLTVPRKDDGELILVTGLSNGQPVTKASVPDQRLNVQEGGGLVLLDKRTVSLSLPLPQPIDTLEVQVPGQEVPSRFDVSRTVYSFCEENPKENFCRGQLK